MSNQKLNKEAVQEMGRHAEESFSRNRHSPFCVGGIVLDNDDVAQHLLELLDFGILQGRARDLVVIAAARLAANNVVMRQPDLEYSEVHGSLEHCQAQQIASSAVVQHHYVDKHKRVHVVICDQEGTVKSRQIMGEAASAEWFKEYEHNHRRR